MGMHCLQCLGLCRSPRGLVPTRFCPLHLPPGGAMEGSLLLLGTFVPCLGASRMSRTSGPNDSLWVGCWIVTMFSSCRRSGATPPMPSCLLGSLTSTLCTLHTCKGATMGESWLRSNDPFWPGSKTLSLLNSFLGEFFGSFSRP